MARVKVRLDERSIREFGQRILHLVSTAPDRPLDRLVVKSGGTTRFVRVADIDATTGLTGSRSMEISALREKPIGRRI